MRDYFCGWYLKCQNSTQTIAVIPAFHITGGNRTCSIQLITDNASWHIPFPWQDFQMTDSVVDIGKNHFGPGGFSLDLHTQELTAVGRLTFGPLTPIRYDIMGPFKYVPFLECRHSVFSMKHSVSGTLLVNGKSYAFANGTGYMEGDRSHSFPREYLWTQCSFPEGSIMLSVADIPFCGFHFTGVISAIHCRGKEYRLGTYWGARAVSIHDGEVIIKQGRKVLTVKRLEQKGLPLSAPQCGAMSRTIHETAACKVYFHFCENGETIFEFEADNASFEYEYPQ